MSWARAKLGRYRIAPLRVRIIIKRFMDFPPWLVSLFRVDDDWLMILRKQTAASRPSSAQKRLFQFFFFVHEQPFLA
ncbi:MAG: hypothetical protein A2V67_11805 [Deltaproteobacteria bacterium RBG_13_61_14]|nr:MAG: hypothetical protein A2V67_11805 [Deltaproteobacteria bacterium RBG_13_61_14]